MGKLYTIQAEVIRTVIFASAALIAVGCSSAASTNGTASAADTASTTSTSSTGTLTLTPSAITLANGAEYTFTTTGGSGSGYYYQITPSTAGTVNSSTGFFEASTTWTGTASLQVTDTLGNVAVSTVTIGATTTTTTGNGTVYTTTGSLNNCQGEYGGSEYTNNWQVNGNELRTINDYNYSYESPVYCTGLTGASVPSTATIVGVSVSIFLINQSSSADGSMLLSMSLINNYSLVGATKTLDLMIPGNTASYPTTTQGSSTDLWSGSMTPATFSSSTFGIDIQTFRASNRLFLGEAAGVVPQVTIYYTN